MGVGVRAVGVWAGVVFVTAACGRIHYGHGPRRDGSPVDGGSVRDAQAADAADGAEGGDAASLPSFVPSNLPDESVWTRGTGELRTPSSGCCTVVDSDDGEITGAAVGNRAAGEGLDSPSGVHFEVVSQGSDAPPLGVFVVTQLDIEGQGLRVRGRNALVLIVDGEARIEGLIEPSATASDSRVGGFAEGGPTEHGSGPGGGEGDLADGGAGAGHASRGGNGDNPGGSTYGRQRLVPLIGGSGGGGGDEAAGGQGGPAFQISARGSIHVGAAGAINAGGRGGAGSDGGGGGGGSGGAILVEAPAITLDGILAANGGGGGSGCGTDAGGDGDASMERASGGKDGACGSGGAGAAGDRPAAAGDPDDDGGGGGGRGRIYVRTASGTLDGTPTYSPTTATGATSLATLP